MPTVTRRPGVAMIACLTVLASAQAQSSCDLPLTLPPKEPTQVLHYSTRHDIFDQIDLYMPEGIAQPPLIVLVHGGGWVHDTGEPGYRNDAMYLMSKGYAVANVKYRLADPSQPGSVFPAAVQDLRCGMRFLRANQKALGFRSGKVGALGGSAGGNLVAMLGVLPAAFQADTTLIPFTDALTGCLADAPGRQHERSDVDAVAAYYPVSNVTDPAALYVDSGGGAGWRRYLGLPESTPVLDNKTVEYATPEFYIGKPAIKAKLPPFLIVNGTDDTVVPPMQSTDLTNALNAVRPNLAKHDVLEGLSHGFPAFNVQNPKIRAAACDVVSFFQANVASK